MASVGQVFPHVTAWLEARLGQSVNPVVLEAGAGAGQYAKYVKAGKYFSFDIPESWYEYERRPSVWASADALPFQADFFDLAFCVSAFDYFPNPQEVMKEVARCLKPGGIFLIATYDKKTLDLIHRRCLELPPGPAVNGHHVYDASTLFNYGSRAGMAGRQLPYKPEIGVVERIKLAISPTNLRTFELRKPL